MGTMPDQNEILRRLAAQAGNPNAIDQLRAALNTPDGKKAAQVISSQHAATLERAAQEGAHLAQQLRQIFRK